MEDNQQPFTRKDVELDVLRDCLDRVAKRLSGHAAGWQKTIEERICEFGDDSLSTKLLQLVLEQSALADYLKKIATAVDNRLKFADPESLKQLLAAVAAGSVVNQSQAELFLGMAQSGIAQEKWQ